MTLRVPVPATARNEGIRVLEHYRALIPERKPGLAYRRPKLVLGCAVALAIVSAILGGIGWTMNAAGNGSYEIAILAIGGTMVSIGALIFTAIIGIAVRLNRA